MGQILRVFSRPGDGGAFLGVVCVWVLWGKRSKGAGVLGGSVSGERLPEVEESAL